MTLGFVGEFLNKILGKTDGITMVVSEWTNIGSFYGSSDE